MVPLRARPCNIANGGNVEGDDIGFLCIDSDSRYRLNGGFHVEILAAFADQLYNFFSFMRGTYKASAGDEKEDDGLEHENGKDGIV